MKKTAFTLFALFGFTLAAFAQTASDKAAFAAKPDIVKADPAAYNLLKEARSSSRNFPESFGGYSANVTFNDNGTVYRGTVDYTPKDELKFEMKGLAEDLSKKLEGDLNSLISHRRGGDFTKGDGRYPITYGEDDKSPIGRLLLLNDEMNSSYRIRDNQVVQVNRTFSGETILINILETTPTENGQFLPRQFAVTYVDPKTGAIKRTQAFTDKYELVGGAWLPKSRRVITTENGVTKVTVTEFENFKVKSAVAVAK